MGCYAQMGYWGFFHCGNVRGKFWEFGHVRWKMPVRLCSWKLSED